MSLEVPELREPRSRLASRTVSAGLIVFGGPLRDVSTKDSLRYKFNTNCAMYQVDRINIQVWQELSRIVEGRKLRDRRTGAE